MSSTKISDLPDSANEEMEVVVQEERKAGKKVRWADSLPGESKGSFIDILVVFGLLLGATNSELSKSVLRFPLLKLQKTDLMLSVLLSVIFAIIFAIYKLF